MIWSAYPYRLPFASSCTSCSSSTSYSITPVAPRMRIFPLSRRFFMRMPPVFWLLIMSYFHHSHPRKMGSCHHIGKAGIFVGCRDCRSASVLCLRDRFEFFAYPISFMGGVNLLIINFQVLLIVGRYACCNAEWKSLIYPPPLPNVGCRRNILRQGGMV